MKQKIFNDIKYSCVIDAGHNNKPDYTASASCLSSSFAFLSAQQLEHLSTSRNRDCS